jgi:hypothetical protein
MAPNAALLEEMFQNRCTIFQGEVIAPDKFLKNILPPLIYELINHFWDLKLAVCIAGSAASYTKGIVKHFQDVDMFMTSDVLR